MNISIRPTPVAGIIYAPASKSSMQRALAAALLHVGTTHLYNPGRSNDDKAAMGILKQLGAEIIDNNDSLIIHSKGLNPLGAHFNCGESGLGIRLFTPIISLMEQESLIDGEGSLRTRPMDFFDEILPQLGIIVSSHDGKIPLKVKGPLVPKEITIDGSLSSQFLTGLLFAYGSVAKEEVLLHVNGLTSKPYIDLTLKVMDHFGFTVTHDSYEIFHVFPKKDNVGDPLEYTVEGDWSGGAFLLVAGAVAGPITVKGLEMGSTQADKAILKALQACGAAIQYSDEGIIVGPSNLQSFSFDATECPDLFPPLVALAAYCKGTSTIKGVNRLTHKESDRGLTLQQEFGKLGVDIFLDGDSMYIKGGNELCGGTVHSNHDHRIVMACAVAALRAAASVRIMDAEAVNKSYPQFFEHLIRLGVTVSKAENLNTI